MLTDQKRIYNILVIEDNYPDYRMIDILLSNHEQNTLPFQYTLLQAQYLNQGVSFFEKNAFDIVLLDLNLPDSNGIQTIKKFFSYVEDCPVIILTGINDAEIGYAAIREGAEDYLIKGSFESLFLVKTILYAIERFQNKRGQIKLAVQENRVTSLRQLISDVAHDFRTPLSAISTSLYLYNKTQNNEYLETISGQVHYLRDMLEDFLQLSKLDNETEILSLFTQDIVKTVRDLCDDYSGIAEAKGKKMFMNSDIEYCFVKYDRKLIYRAFLNIINNAIKYTGDNGIIELKTGQTGKKFFFEVIDNGIGIDEESLPKVFDRFYRSDPARSSNTGGSGLGLSICKKIIDIHKGTIKITSEIGVGTTVRVEMDIADEELAKINQDNQNKTAT